MPKTMLVTGGAGFIGANFVEYALAHTDYSIINLDLLTYAGNLANLTEVENHPRYQFVQGDIRDRDLLERLFTEHTIDCVVHFAAESHVDRSITEPEIFLSTNILGTQALLDVAKKHWSLAPEDKHCREFREGVRFLQVSTDEVYGALGATGLFSETTPLAPNSPYAASKASADMLVRAYGQTYAMPVSITRCSNNYGPYQFPEKLIPLMICNAVAGKALPVYGDGAQIRDWLYVEDHCSAILAVLERGKAGEVYNVGGGNERTNLELIRFILKHLGASESLITHVKDRPGHDRRYAIDSTKLQRELGWQPKYDFVTGMEKTIAWYQNNTAWLDGVLSGAYQDYYRKMYGKDV